MFLEVFILIYEICVHSVPFHLWWRKIIICIFFLVFFKAHSLFDFSWCIAGEILNFC